MKFDALLFDCDGVLVDSEHITTAVLRDMLAEAGWVMTAQECLDTFLGKAVLDQSALIAERTGQAVTPEWLDGFRRRRDVRLAAEVRAIPGVATALQTLHAQYGSRMACASGADRGKIELQLGQTGLSTFFSSERIYSGYEQAQNKPAPDVYLAAARGLGVQAPRCAVIEDSPTGVRAGAAAGALVLGYAPLGHEEALLAAGATRVFRHMDELPALLLG